MRSTSPPSSVAHWLRALTLAVACVGYSAPGAAVGPDDLPDIGSSASAAISVEDEYRIGLGALRELRASGQVLEDPEVTQYIDTLGHQLSADAQDGIHKFQFFVVKDRTLNAFAVPGGFIFVHSGLILETHNESELAGVLAHEISHVTQRHIVRSLLEQRKSGMTSAAAMLAAILLGAAGGADVALAGIAGAQTLALGQQMSFSRDMESEADRVGIAVLARAGFDPLGMPNFFEIIASRTGGAESRLPAIVLDHPVNSERIAESKARAATFPNRLITDSAGYSLVRERLRVLTTPPGENALPYYMAAKRRNEQLSAAQRYGEALALMSSNRPAEAIPILKALAVVDERIVQYRVALGEAQLLTGDGKAAKNTFEQSLKLFPRNIAVTVRYADALVRLGEPQRAHTLLLDLFNNVPPTPEQARQIAFAANAAGETADAYSYMAEYHLMTGDLPLAMTQLQMALSAPKLSGVQRARFRARLDEIRAAMPRRSPRENQDGGHSR